MCSLSRPSMASFCIARSVRSGTPRRIGHHETMKPMSRLTLDSAQRVIADLSTNNLPRGAWAEHLFLISYRSPIYPKLAVLRHA